MSLRVADLFAGWGGFSLGAEQAGAEVLYAANHNPLCVRAHELNLPRARHECQDLNQANFRDLPEIDLLLAAPACQGHSKASQPRRRGYHDALRSTAWAVISAADAANPEWICVENVSEFLRWRLFPAWRGALTLLGYRLEFHTLTASHHGVPQRRKRLFVVGRRGTAPGLSFTQGTEPAAGPCIDWTEGKWRSVRKATPGVRRRIRRAQSNHGARCFSQHVTGHAGVGLGEPLRTVTAQDHWVAVDGNRYRPLMIRETARVMGFPDNYLWPESTRREAIRGLGNAVCPPVAKDIVTAIMEAA
jgi:DNA (cytosine-5)-methyltransferase 1